MHAALTPQAATSATAPAGAGYLCPRPPGTWWRRQRFYTAWEIQAVQPSAGGCSGLRAQPALRQRELRKRNQTGAWLSACSNVHASTSCPASVSHSRWTSRWCSTKPRTWLSQPSDNVPNADNDPRQYRADKPAGAADSCPPCHTPTRRAEPRPRATS